MTTNRDDRVLPERNRFPTQDRIQAIYRPLHREFTDFNQIRPGSSLNTRRFETKRFFNELEAGILGGLFTQKESSENGLAQIDNIRDIMEINYFQHIVDKHLEGIVAENLMLEGELSEEQEQLKKKYEISIKEQLRRAVRWRLTNGVGILAVRMGEDGPYIDAVNPEHYFEVRLNQYTYKVEGHLIAVPFESNPNIRPNNSVPFFDRLHVTFFDRARGINVVRIFRYNKGYINGQIGSDMKSDFIDIQVFGMDLLDSLFPKLIDPVKNILIKETLRNKVLNENASPKIIPPIGVSPQSAKKGFKDRFLRRGSDPRASEWNNFSTDPVFIPYVENQIQELRETILQFAHLPPGSINFDGLKGESGASKQEQKTMLTTLQRDIQNEIVSIMPDIFMSMGFGDINVRFPSDPYVSQTVREANARQDFISDAITRNELRHILGYGPALIDGDKYYSELKQSQDRGNNNGEIPSK